MKRNITLCIISVLVSSLLNCATGIRSAMYEYMATKEIKAAQPLGESIYVDFVEGADKNNLLTNIEITKALRSSLLGGNFFKELNAKEGDDFDLKTNIIKIDNPGFGAAFTINSEIKYSIYRKKTLIKEFTVIQKGEASASEEFVGFKRLVLAYERSIQNNIKDFLKELNKMN